MPLLSESLLKIYRATRRLGNGRPVLVIAADTTNLNNPLSEFYFFHEFPDMPFLYGRTAYSHPDSLYLYDFGKYSETFSASALLEKQFRAAQDRLEQEVIIRERQVATELFYSASSLKYEETGKLPFVEFVLFQRFTKERDAMFKFSKSMAIAQLLEKLSDVPETVVTQEPKK
jgi:hypothetical protein